MLLQRSRRIIVKSSPAPLIINQRSCMDTLNKIQLNANLRFNPAGQLVGRDLLINFREQSVAECVKLLNDFNRQFNLNLGLPEAKPAEVAVSEIPRCRRCNVPMRKMQSKFSSNAWYGCPNWRVNGCLEKQPA